MARKARGEAVVPGWAGTPGRLKGRLRASHVCHDGALPGAAQPKPLALRTYRDAPSLSTQATGLPGACSSV